MLKRWIKIVLVLLIFILTLFSVYAEAPSNDAIFYLDSYNDKFITIGFDDFPAQDLGLDKSVRGFLILNGQVIYDINPTVNQAIKDSGSLCNNNPGIVCKFEGKITSTYESGHIDIIYRIDKTVTFNGNPISPGGQPVEPTTLKLFNEKHIKGDFIDANLMKFEGTVEKKSSWNWVFGCSKWQDNDVGGICLLENYKTDQVKTDQYKWWGFVKAPANGNAVVSMIRGDVEVSKDNGKKFIPAKVGDILKKGDYIGNGFESTSSLDFGYGKLDVYQITQIRIDELTSKEKLAKTQLYLRVGSVAAKVKHTAAIRSDFAVTMPSATTGVRGSKMFVKYDNNTNTATVYTLEDQAYVKGILDTSETIILEGKKVNIDSSGKSSQPEIFSKNEIPPSLYNSIESSENSEKNPDKNTNESSSYWIYAIIVIIVLVLIYFYYNKNFKKK